MRSLDPLVGRLDVRPVLLDPAVATADQQVAGSGLRRSKLVLPGAVLATLPCVQVIDGLGRSS